MAHNNGVVKVNITTQQGCGNGTGFMSDAATHEHWHDEILTNPRVRFVTNYHVVANATSVAVQLPCFSHDLPCTVRGVAPNMDLAVIELTQHSQLKALDVLKEKYGPDTEFSDCMLSFADSDVVHSKWQKDGECRISAVGYPLGAKYRQVTRGEVVGVRHVDGKMFMVTSAGKY